MTDSLTRFWAFCRYGLCLIHLHIPNIQPNAPHAVKCSKCMFNEWMDQSVNHRSSQGCDGQKKALLTLRTAGTLKKKSISPTWFQNHSIFHGDPDSPLSGEWVRISQLAHGSALWNLLGDKTQEENLKTPRVILRLKKVLLFYIFLDALLCSPLLLNGYHWK